jgi:hypothetical protein
LRRFIGPKRIVILTVLAVLVGIAWYLRRQGWLDPSAIQHLIEQYPVTAPIVFAAIYGIAMLSALPTLPVNLAAGLFWGPLLGGLYSTSGATIGAIAAFLLTRSVLGQPLARRFDNRVIAEISTRVRSQGLAVSCIRAAQSDFPDWAAQLSARPHRRRHRDLRLDNVRVQLAAEHRSGLDWLQSRHLVNPRRDRRYHARHSCGLGSE